MKEDSLNNDNLPPDFEWEDVTEDNVVAHVKLMKAELTKFGNWIYRESQKRRELERKLQS